MPLSTQFETAALDDSHQTPPPDWLVSESPEICVAPLVSVKPASSAPLVRYTHRTAVGPRGPEPTILVAAGPSVLRTITGLVTATRLLMPYTSRAPV